CHAGLDRVGRQTFKCEQCDKNYHVDEAVLYAVAEFHLLFPDKKIRVEKILDWCGDAVSAKFIGRVLARNLSKVAKSRYTYYYFEDKQQPFLLLSRKYK